MNTGVNTSSLSSYLLNDPITRLLIADNCLPSRFSAFPTWRTNMYSHVPSKIHWTSISIALRSVLSFIFFFFGIVCLPENSFALDAPTISAAAKGPNQINLSWYAVTDPGYGYRVEIQSNGDSRYSSWIDYTATLRNGFGYLPYWVAESHYLDRSDGSGTASSNCITASSVCGSRAQLLIFGLKYGTTYNFRVRSYGKTDTGVASYSSYSAVASATTTTPSIIRHVKQGGTGNGTSEANAWGSLSSANGVAAGTLVIIHGGTYSAATLTPSNSGTQSARIVYQADPGESVILTAPSGRMLYIAQNYITIDGFTMHDPNGTTDEVIYITGSRNVIANTTLDGPSPTRSGYSPTVMGSYNVFENNYWKEYGTMDGTSGSILGVFGNYNVISNVHHEKGGHDTLIVRGDWTLIANSLFDGGWGMGIELQGTGGYIAQYNLVEGNIMKDASTAGAPWQRPYKPTIEVSADHNVVRRNIVRSGSSHGIEVSSVLQAANYNLIYNNVIYRNPQLAIVFYQGTVDHNTIANNTLYYNSENYSLHGCTNSTMLWYTGYTGSTFHHNHMLYKSGGTENPTYGKFVDYPNGDACRALSQWESYAPAVAYSNTTITPSYIDEANYDFHLKSTSGLRGIGTTVTDGYWGTTGQTDIGAYKYFGGLGGAGGLLAPADLIILQ